MAVLGLRFCARAFSSCGKRGPLFIAVHGPLTIAASLVAEHRLRRAGSVIVAHGPSCSTACGNFPDQGSNPCPLHWQADSQPLRHQGSPSIGEFLQACDLLLLRSGWGPSVPLFHFLVCVMGPFSASYQPHRPDHTDRVGCPPNSHYTGSIYFFLLDDLRLCLDAQESGPFTAPEGTCACLGHM